MNITSDQLSFSAFGGAVLCWMVSMGISASVCSGPFEKRHPVSLAIHPTVSLHSGLALNPHTPLAPYDFEIRAVARAYRVDPLLVKAIIAVESGFDARLVSNTGACGLMQLMPGTAHLLQVNDVFDPAENIHGGVRHLRYLLVRFRNDLPLTLAAYNAGERPVLRYKGVPPYVETQGYVRHVLQTYNVYKNSQT